VLQLQCFKEFASTQLYNQRVTSLVDLLSLILYAKPKRKLNAKACT